MPGCYVGHSVELGHLASMRPSAFTDGYPDAIVTSRTAQAELHASMRPSAFTDGYEAEVQNEVLDVIGLQ